MPHKVPPNGAQFLATSCRFFSGVLWLALISNENANVDIPKPPSGGVLLSLVRLVYRCLRACAGVSHAQKNEDLS